MVFKRRIVKGDGAAKDMGFGAPKLMGHAFEIGIGRGG